MGAAAAIVESSQFGIAVGEANGYVSAVREYPRRSQLSKNVLLRFRKDFNEILRLGTDVVKMFRLSLRGDDIDHADGITTDVLFATLANNTKTLARILNQRGEIVRHHRTLAAYWSVGLQEKLLDLVDDMEDICETLALGKNAECRQEIRAAADEAAAALVTAH